MLSYIPINWEAYRYSVKLKYSILSMLKKNQPWIWILFSVIVLYFLTSLTGDKFCLIYARYIRKPLIVILAFLSIVVFIDVKE